LLRITFIGFGWIWFIIMANWIRSILVHESEVSVPAQTYPIHSIEGFPWLLQGFTQAKPCFLLSVSLRRGLQPFLSLFILYYILCFRLFVLILSFLTVATLSFVLLSVCVCR
jgi:hypothetical protein